MRKPVLGEQIPQALCLMMSPLFPVLYKMIHRGFVLSVYIFLILWYGAIYDMCSSQVHAYIAYVCVCMHAYTQSFVILNGIILNLQINLRTEFL